MNRLNIRPEDDIPKEPKPLPTIHHMIGGEEEEEEEDYPNGSVGVPPVRIHIIYSNEPKVIEAKDKLLYKFHKKVENAKITSEMGPEGVYEIYMNDKIVFSRENLRGVMPVQDEMVEIAIWANKGKSFMHMYLCTFAEGGECKMVIADRKNTPLAKRLILACVIS